LALEVDIRGMAKITLSIIKADIGSIGGHITPSQKVLEAVENYIKQKGRGLILIIILAIPGMTLQS